MKLKLPPLLPNSPDAALCPVRDVLDHVGDRWSFLTLLTLDLGTHRFSELQRAIGDVSKRMLAETLRRLERDGYVTRTVYASVPPKVEYALTTLGQSLVKQLKPLFSWADRHHTQVKAARKAYKPPAATPAL